MNLKYQDSFNGTNGAEVIKNRYGNIDVFDLPFFGNDCTIGVENELQASVFGRREYIDLYQTILNSSYYDNLLGQDDPASAFKAEEIKKLYGAYEKIFENSFVRIPEEKLSPYARSVFEVDLRSDRNDPESFLRKDSSSFFVEKEGIKYIRVPISYLLKLAMADLMGNKRKNLPFQLMVSAEKIMKSFLNDNTSPELTSFFETKMGEGKDAGSGFVKETKIRFFLVQLLMIYANKKFGLIKSGQKAMIYFTPHTPLKQKKLNNIIPDSFYRELFMSPCLSGWRYGEKKSKYMALCHEVLSRSQLNAIGKLKDAGIINRNLVVLPNTSNTSLSNNGTHINTGSIKLTSFMEEGIYSRSKEKNISDLVSKIFEHFIPLFINTYSAAPFRMDFTDFHPERALGFLPHELDITHLEMFWESWKKKADISFLGRVITPFGPLLLDNTIKKVLGLKGDFIPDIRLLDYFVTLMSTPNNPALNGVEGNTERLLQDLSRSGVFHQDMSIYLLFRGRYFHQSGFSGYEGRYYSTFENFDEDMRFAGVLQALITSLAYKYIFSGSITHDDIPDFIPVESERRYPVFASACGMDHFYVYRKTKNRFLLKILSKIDWLRPDRKYRKYFAVNILQYQKALIEILAEDGEDIIKEAGLSFIIEDLKARVNSPAKFSAMSKLISGITSEKSTNQSFSPMDFTSEEFNRVSEDYYRVKLKEKHFKSSMKEVRENLRQMSLWIRFRDEEKASMAAKITGGKDMHEFFIERESSILDESISVLEVEKVIWLVLFIIDNEINKNL